MKTMKLASLLVAFFLRCVVIQATPHSFLDDFLQCLPNHCGSTVPISKAIYTPDNPLFSPLLLNRTANRRYTIPTTSKPLAIIAPEDPSHVQATVICAKAHGLQIRTRSGGHDYEGLSYVSQVPFIVLDMFNLRSIQIDIKSETAYVQAGATLGEIYYSIAKKSDVFAFPAGVCITLGAGGHISGGGYGNLMRKYGLSVDNVVDAELVDVNGRILNRKTMGEDLFWAIRGSGGASFGVVLSWTLKLVSVPPKVTVFNVKRTIAEGATDLVYKWEQVVTGLDDNLFIRVMPMVVNKTVQVSFIGEYLGQIDTLLPYMTKSFPELGLKQSDCIEMPWVNSTLFWALYPTSPIETLLTKKGPADSFFKSRSDYVKKPISKEDIDSIWKMLINVENMWMQWNPYGGQMSEISESATPFPHRAGTLFLIQYYTSWDKEGIEETQRNMNHSRTFHDFMTKFVSENPREAFLNYRDLDIGANPSGETRMEKARVYGSKYFKDNFERLVQVKTTVDPDNFFKNEQSIPPATSYLNVNA